MTTYSPSSRAFGLLDFFIAALLLTGCPKESRQLGKVIQGDDGGSRNLDVSGSGDTGGMGDRSGKDDGSDATFRGPCTLVGCSAPPLCSEGCRAPCGCCTCAPGERNGGLVCTTAGCYAPMVDGGGGGAGGSGETGGNSDTGGTTDTRPQATDGGTEDAPSAHDGGTLPDAQNRYPTAYLAWQAPGGVIGTGPALVASGSGWLNTFNRIAGFPPTAPPTSTPDNVRVYSVSSAQLDDLFNRLASANLSSLPHPSPWIECYQKLYFRLCTGCAATTLEYNRPAQLLPEIESVWAWFDSFLGATAATNPRNYCAF